MKLYKILYTLFLLTLHCKIKTQPQYQTELTEGLGYSSDSLMPAPAICYNPILTKRTKQTSEINFDNSYNFDKITDKFNISSNFNVGIGNFQIGALFSYLKEHEETSFSESFNYFQKITGNVEMYYSYKSEDLLNDTGKKIYENGENPLFRILCGDRLISSYEEGAALIFSLKLVFKDSSQKSEFKTKVNFPFGNILNISPEIEKITKKQNLGGVLKISGFQLGGDPTQLSRIISLKTSTCSLNKMEDCQDMIKTMIDYASNEFPKQFKNEDGKWTSSLVPLGQFTKDFSVDEFGVKLAKSFVDEKVLKLRYDLVGIFQKAKFNFFHVNFIYENYPGVFREEEFRVLHNAYEVTKFNYDLVRTTCEPLFCWKEPQKCESIVEFILDNYKEVVLSDFFEGTFQTYFEMDCKFKGKFWPIGNSKEDINTKIMYQNLYDNEKNDWYLINTDKEYKFTAKEDGSFIFNVEGDYHDNGKCPQVDNFILMWYSKDNYSFRRHIHKVDKCTENWFNEDCGIKMKKNPFYFQILKQPTKKLKDLEI